MTLTHLQHPTYDNIAYYRSTNTSLTFLYHKHPLPLHKQIPRIDPSERNQTCRDHSGRTKPYAQRQGTPNFKYTYSLSTNGFVNHYDSFSTATVLHPLICPPIHPSHSLPPSLPPSIPTHSLTPNALNEPS